MSRKAPVEDPVSGRSSYADGELLERVAGDDKDAFRELYTRYYPRLFGYLMRMTLRAGLAEEVLNDVMMVVWRNAHRFEGRSRVSTWIFGIAHRQALQALRTRRRSPRVESLDPEALVTPDSPHQGAVRRERRDRLTSALRRLSPAHRAVIELTYLQGFSCPEIARITRCPVGTVKSRMHHARKALRRLLPELEEDESR